MFDLFCFCHRVASFATMNLPLSYLPCLHKIIASLPLFHSMWLSLVYFQCRIGSETESMNSISSTDDTFQWGGPHTQEPDDSLRFGDESHGLMDSCLWVLLLLVSPVNSASHCLIPARLKWVLKYMWMVHTFILLSCTVRSGVVPIQYLPEYFDVVFLYILTLEFEQAHLGTW